MLGCIEPALFIVREDRWPDARLVGRSPADEMRLALKQGEQLRAMLTIVAIAQEDDPVRLAAILIIHVPVRRELLKGYQQVVSPLGTAAHHRAEHGQVEWIDQRSVGRGLFEEQQGERLRMLPPQAR